MANRIEETLIENTNFLNNTSYIEGALMVFSMHKFVI